MTIFDEIDYLLLLFPNKLNLITNIKSIFSIFSSISNIYAIIWL